MTAATALIAQSFVLRLVKICNLKIVVDAENGRRPVGLHFCDGGVACIIDDPFQGDISVLDDDVNSVIPDRGIVSDAKGHAEQALR